MKRFATPLEQALAFLKRKDYSRQEMWNALRKKGYNEREISSSIDRLLEWGYLNDEFYARNRIEKFLEQKKSRRYITFKLEQAGIATEIIEKELNRLYPETKEKEILDFYWKYLEKTSKKGNLRKEKVKWARKLIAAGFPPELVERYFELESDT